MVKFSTIEKGLKLLSNNLNKNIDKGILAISIQLAKDAQSLSYVPRKDGDLGDSALLTPKNLLSQGTIIWNKPYASSVYEKNKTGVPFWDKATWDKNIDLYEKQALVLWEKDIFK